MNKISFKVGSGKLPVVESKKLEKKLQPYVKTLLDVTLDKKYTYDESSINLPIDSSLLRMVKKTVLQVKKPGLKFVVVIGIGGSNLGAKAVYTSVKGSYDSYSAKKGAKMLFLDTTDQKVAEDLSSVLTTSVKRAQEVLIVVVSKSGMTTETLANTEALLKRLRHIKNIEKRIVVISDKNSPLIRKAKKEKLSYLTIPEKVGGRFSVFSAVGLFPLAITGIDVEALRKGATHARKASIQPSVRKNPAMASAIFQYYHFKERKTISDTFIFHPELESVGKWYRQLMGESLGKEKNKNGKNVHTGITPTVTIGSTDLHSMGQLYMGGPKDKMTTFITTKHYPKCVPVPRDIFFDVLPDISGNCLSDIMEAIQSGTLGAYKRLSLPFSVLELDSISEESLGEFLQMKMFEMMYLGYLLNVNTFNQPNIELYKSITRKILKKS